jgi:hypothetical protein
MFDRFLKLFSDDKTSEQEALSHVLNKMQASVSFGSRVFEHFASGGATSVGSGSLGNADMPIKRVIFLKKLEDIHLAANKITEDIKKQSGEVQFSINIAFASDLNTWQLNEINDLRLFFNLFDRFGYSIKITFGKNQLESLPDEKFEALIQAMKCNAFIKGKQGWAVTEFQVASPYKNSDTVGKYYYISEKRVNFINDQLPAAAVEHSCIWWKFEDRPLLSQLLMASDPLTIRHSPLDQAMKQEEAKKSKPVNFAGLIAAAGAQALQENRNALDDDEKKTRSGKDECVSLSLSAASSADMTNTDKNECPSPSAATSSSSRMGLR